MFQTTIICAFFQDFQWQLGALCVFWSWINLLLFIRKLPVFGIYVVMFTTILRSFMLFFPILMLFIIAFAISFYCLLANQVSAQSPFMAVFRLLFDCLSTRYVELHSAACLPTKWKS
jgi:hypothetical protein